MIDTMTRYLEAVVPDKSAYNLRQILAPIVDRMSTQPQTSAGLVIHGAGSTLAKTGSSDFYASVKGTLVTIAASTDMPALTGLTIAANQFNIAAFFVDAAGVVTVAFGTAGATVGAAVFPAFPVNKALVGYLVITNGSTFTGGTTPLDTATTVYVSPLGPFDPSVLI